MLRRRQQPAQPAPTPEWQRRFDGALELERLASDSPGVSDGLDRRRQERSARDHDEVAPNKGSKKKRKKRLSERLGDVFEEIIDL